MVNTYFDCRMHFDLRKGVKIEMWILARKYGDHLKQWAGDSHSKAGGWFTRFWV